MEENKFEEIVNLAKKRGFIFPSSEIYGGFSSCYDYGPLGVEMKNKIKNFWWQTMTRRKEKVFGLDSAILMAPKVWEASGHLAGFVDQLVECKNCKKRFRIDEIKEKKCPECQGELTEPKNFNLMMKTFIGPLEDKASITFLRPETCQGIYVNFLNVQRTMRSSLPFGICQIGKAFRNEISPRNFLYRLREFEQMEFQWFCDPGKADFWFDFWLKERLAFLERIGLKKENIRVFEVPEKERAHYAKRQIDIEFKFPFGWKEIEGVHNRGDWDLSRHSQFSGKDLSYFDPETKKRFIPYIIETSVGVDRLFFALLCDAFEEFQKGRSGKGKEKEILLKLSPLVAPVEIAVLPLVQNNSDIVKISREIFESLQKEFLCFYDQTGSIGRRYRRQDEIGTVFAITVDFQTLEDRTVTVRDRDTMKQERKRIEELKDFFREKLRYF